MELLTIFFIKRHRCPVAPFMTGQGDNALSCIRSPESLGLLLLEYKKNSNVIFVGTCVGPSIDAGPILMK